MDSLLDRLDKANGLTEEDFKPQNPVIEVAEMAYVDAELALALIEETEE